MSQKLNKKIRREVRKKIKFDYDKFITEIEKEPFKTKIKFLFGLIKRLLIKKGSK